MSQAKIIQSTTNNGSERSRVPARCRVSLNRKILSMLAVHKTLKYDTKYFSSQYFHKRLFFSRSAHFAVKQHEREAIYRVDFITKTLCKYLIIQLMFILILVVDEC